jgi:hypothetical protein
MQCTSIHIFEQPYFNPATRVDEAALVYLTIDHDLKRYTVEPGRPFIGHLDFHTVRSASSIQGIDEFVFQFKDISTDFARHLATLSCIYRAMLYACEELAIAKPTDIEAAKRLFIIDPQFINHEDIT